ncbi:MAG: 2-C-methyl-D-erythritol 4-phosphate cytidylyltransferase [Tannerella sp.]|jgi:2-C-methyl-D-erythritol 4-phosphate cytidylyltransferase|nr:2-C-methyl-D-erythritol 4-phosphate cytidylyltransferase [Tannerella sp.]
MKRTVIIVAGGRGVRMGGSLPKQFIPLHGKPVLMHTLEVFHQWDASAGLLVVIPREHAPYWAMLCRELRCDIPHRVVYGGDTRFQSVKNGLEQTEAADGIIAVHDGVRPLVARDVISSCFAAADAFGAAIPVVPVIESVREMNESGSRPFDRNRLCLVQTPQVFRAEWLHRAYGRPCDGRFTDDASLVEAAGHAIRLVDGNRENIKITTPMDIKCAEFLLAEKMEMQSWK